jgi:hypothetical protein
MKRYRVGFTTEPDTITDGLGVKEYLYENEIGARSTLEYIDEIDEKGNFVRMVYRYQRGMGLLVDYNSL